VIQFYAVERFRRRYLALVCFDRVKTELQQSVVLDVNIESIHLIFLLTFIYLIIHIFYYVYFSYLFGYSFSYSSIGRPNI